MIRIAKSFLLIIGTCAFSWVNAQELLTQERFFEWIKQYHPVARQSSLLPEEAEAYLRKARGGFDPKLDGDLEQKYFDQKNYYLLAQGQLKVPTWYGLEFKGAMTWADGVYLNPEHKLPDVGQAVLGLKANLIQGLLIDERRATLQKAQIMQSANANEQAMMLNDLLMNASIAYWEWSYAFNVVEIYEEALTFAEDRLEGVRQQVIQGDKPAVDTLESGIQVKQRRLERSQAQLAYQNATLHLLTFLWEEGDVPYNAWQQLQPPPLNQPAAGDVINRSLASWQSVMARHPDLEKFRFKLNELEVDRRYRRDQLRPKLTVEYNLLGNGVNFLNGQDNGSTLNQLVANNYKWGATFSFPLFQRKARGDLALNRIKMENLRYELNLKRQTLQVKLEQYYNQLVNVYQQIELQREIVTDRENLLVAENEKFRIGESSIFLINSREQKLLEDRIKLEKLKATFLKTETALSWVNGTLWE